MKDFAKNLGIMIDSDLLRKNQIEFTHHVFDLNYMASCLRDQELVQDERFDSHLTGFRNESFNWLTETIAHIMKAFH